MSNVSIRHAEPADLTRLLEIYNHYVLNTHVTFDVEARTLEQRRQWLDSFGVEGRYQCFVAVRDAALLGWCCSGKFKEKSGYDTSVETSIYLAPGEGGKGVGRLIYAHLFGVLGREDLHRAYAGIALPNAASVALHEAMGFRHVGTYGQVGRKFERFWDVAWYERGLP